jgi:hypothetical protein
MAAVITYIAIAATNSEPVTMELDSAYYSYEVIPYDTVLAALPTAVFFDSADQDMGTLRISGAKDFSFDVTQGFDQGLKVDITGEVEGVGIEGNLSDKATPSSTVPISEIERISLKVFTQNFTGGVGNLTLNLPFGVTDEIRGGRIGIHTEDKSKNLSAAYAINRGVFVRTRFIGEEGKQSPYFLTGPVIAGSERVYITQGLERPVMLNADIDYTIDHENGILSFTNRNIITSHTSIEVEYKRAIEDYTNTYTQTDGLLTFDKIRTYGLYRSSADDQNDPLTFNLSPAEIESLMLAGDSARVLHTYADTSAEGSYVIENDHFIFVGQGSGDYDVTFFYVGEGNGEYIYEPVLSAFSYQGPQLGNYSPTKTLPLPRREEFFALGTDLFESLTFELYGSRLDGNTFSAIDDEDNNGFGYRTQLHHTIGFVSLRGNYLKYSDDFFSPTGREAVDYRYVWNTDDTLKEMAEFAVGLAPREFLNMEMGYGSLNRKYKRKFVTIRPFFFVFGYEGIDTLDRFFAGFRKKYKAFAANGRYEKYGAVQILNYGTQYEFSRDISLGLTGAYDHDTLATGISNTLNLTTPVLVLSAGHRSVSDTTFLFGNATVSYMHKGLSLNGDLQQSQRYSQKRDEAYVKVDEGKGDYVYDPITNTYIKKEGGDYIRKIYLLPDFTRVITRNFGIDIGYAGSFYDMNGRFYYIDEKDFRSHSEDLTFNLSASIYDVTLNLRQNSEDDARYALAMNSALERSAALIPSIGSFAGRLELQSISDRIGEQERERRNIYRGELSYDVIQRPIVRPKVGYAYSRLYSEYFADLDIRQHAPKTGILFSLPLRNIKGKVETTAELVYRLYNIEEIPFFFSATEPKGLTTTLGAFVSFGVGANTVFSLIYRIEFRPNEDPNQHFRLQSRIRF